MAGQLAGGWLFEYRASVAVGVATAAGLVNLLLALVVVSRVAEEHSDACHTNSSREDQGRV
ncbi:MAG: hypothetical protein ACKOJF_08415, partial [Planctomycetaceae bacterium]